MDLTKSSETKHLYLGDSSGSLLPTWLRSPNVTSDVNCNGTDKTLQVSTINRPAWIVPRLVTVGMPSW